MNERYRRWLRKRLWERDCQFLKSASPHRPSGTDRHTAGQSPLSKPAAPPPPFDQFSDEWNERLR